MSLPFGYSAPGRSFWVRSSMYVVLIFFLGLWILYVLELKLLGVSSCESDVCSS